MLTFPINAMRIIDRMRMQNRIAFRIAGGREVRCVWIYFFILFLSFPFLISSYKITTTIVLSYLGDFLPTTEDVRNEM